MIDAPESSAVLTRAIPAVNFDALAAKIEKLNKRAAKLKVAPVTLTVLGRETRFTAEKVVREDDFGAYATIQVPGEYVLIEVSGETPKLPGGWTLAAKLEPAEGTDENYVKTVPDAPEIPAEYRTASMRRCDHCRTMRDRKATFVLVDEAGAFKAIGRNCLVNFLGGVDPETLLNAADFVFEIGDEVDAAEGFGYSAGGSYEPGFEPARFLAVVSALSRKAGWIPKSSGLPHATANMALSVLDPPREKAAKEDLAKYLASIAYNGPTDKDYEKALAALEWAKALDPNGSNDFLHNLRLAATAPVVRWKTSGILAAAISAHERALANEEYRKAEKAKREAAPPSEFVGKVGERRGFVGLTVVATRSIPTDFGVSTLVVLKDPAGNLLKWFASGDVTDIYEKGDENVSVTATVKKHDTYNGEKQTMLSRVMKYIDEKKFDPATGLPVVKSRKGKP